MAKGQSRKPGRDVRGGKGGSSRPGANPGYGKGRASAKGSKGIPYAKGRGGAQRAGDHARGGRRIASVGPTYIEGRRACAEALETGVPVKRAFVSRGTGELDDTLMRLTQRVEAAGIEVEYVPKSHLDGMSSHGAHQGIMLEAQPFAYSDLSDILQRAGSDDALVVVLDHVTDEGNLGAIVRSAEVVGAAGVVLPKARSASVGVGAYKTSAGAVLHLPIAQVPNLASAIDQLKEAGFWVAGATEHADQDVWHAPLAHRLCLVMGSENSGISKLVRERCDFECKLPQRGRIESLNVAQAATALCYEWLRRVSCEE